MFALIHAFSHLDAYRGVKAKRSQAAMDGGARSMQSVDRPKQSFPMAALCAAIVINGAPYMAHTYSRLIWK